MGGRHKNLEDRTLYSQDISKTKCVLLDFFLTRFITLVPLVMSMIMKIDSYLVQGFLFSNYIPLDPEREKNYTKM